MQACVILSSSENKETARQFLSFFKTPAIADVMRSYGAFLRRKVASRRFFELPCCSELAAVPLAQLRLTLTACLFSRPIYSHPKLDLELV